MSFNENLPTCITCKNYIGKTPGVGEHTCAIRWERYDFVTGKTESGAYTQKCRDRRSYYLAAAEDCWKGVLS